MNAMPMGLFVVLSSGTVVEDHLLNKFTEVFLYVQKERFLTNILPDFIMLFTSGFIVRLHGFERLLTSYPHISQLILLEQLLPPLVSSWSCLFGCNHLNLHSAI